MDNISSFYILQEKISEYLRNYHKNDSKNNVEFINNLITYFSYAKDKELISFISMTISMYKKEIEDVYNEINEDNKIKLIKNIKPLFPLKNEKEDIYRSLIAFNYQNLCENIQEIKNKNENYTKVLKKEIKKEKENNDEKLIDNIIDGNVKKNDNPNKDNSNHNDKNEKKIYFPKREFIKNNFKDYKETIKKKDNEIIKNTQNKIEKKIKKILNEIKNQDRKVKDYIIENIKKNKMNEIKLITNNSEAISDEIKLQLVTLICILFPFYSLNCKKEILEYLEKYIPIKNNNLNSNLLNDNLSKLNYTYLTDYIKGRTYDDINDTFYKIKLEDEMIERYKLVILSKVFKLNNKDFILKLSFIIYLNLMNEQILNYKLLDFLSLLYFIKEFYSNVYNSQLKEENNFLKYNNKTKEYYFNNIYPNKLQNKTVNDLFSEDEIYIFKKTLSSIKSFYKINDYSYALLIDLKIPYLNQLFSLRILELELLKEKYIKSNITQYKKNLINLETEIYEEIVKKNFMPENKILKTQYINDDIKKKYERFSQELKKNFTNQFKLYPYGSITEFLSSKDSDLDIYLELPRLFDNIKASSYFLINLNNYLSNKFSPNYRLIISKRICLFTFKYNNMDFDISLTGFSPYLHSSIFRAFSLMDSRFPILVCLMKKIIEILDLKYINSKDSNNCNLNSFCWVLLIISYLQDIIFPPILPKIFENCHSINKNISYAFNFVKFKQNKYNNPEFFYFISSMKKECVKIPNETLEGYLNIYKKEIKEKNKLSISELLLGFLEFIIYYFKFDVMYNNFSFDGEGFMNMSTINNNKNDEFYQYYKNKYLKFNSNERDGVFLFRDPFDPHYNPGQTFKVKNISKFYEKLELTYKTLLETGSIKELIKRLEKKK